MRLLTGALFMVLIGQTFAKVGGAIVQSVTIEGNKASITVLNQSENDITGFTIALSGTFADGHQEHSEFTRDFGPLTGNVLAAHQVAVLPYDYQSQPTKVDAHVIVAIYKNGTAEADNKATLDQLVSVRAGIAKALQVSADTLTTALSTSNPTDFASVRFKELLASGDKSVDRSYIKGSIAVVEAAPKGQERKFLEEQAARLQREANAFSAYSNVRRLP